MGPNGMKRIKRLNWVLNQCRYNVDVGSNGDNYYLRGWGKRAWRIVNKEQSK